MGVSRVGIGTLPPAKVRLQPAQALQGMLQNGEPALDARSLARREALELLQDMKYRRAVETLESECGSRKAGFMELANMFLKIAEGRPLQNPNYGMDEAMGEAYGMWSKASNRNQRGFLALCEATGNDLGTALRIVQKYYGNYGLATALEIALRPERANRKARPERQVRLPYARDEMFEAAVRTCGGLGTVMEARKRGPNTVSYTALLREILPGYVVRHFTSAGADWRGIERAAEGLYGDRDAQECFENALSATRKHFEHDKEEKSGPAAFNATMHLLGGGEAGIQKARKAAVPAAMKMKNGNPEEAQNLVAEWEREAKSRYTWFGEWN